MKVFKYAGKVWKYTYFKINYRISWIITYLKFHINGVEFFSDYKTGGVPVINVNMNGKFKIGKGLVLHNGKYFNMIGRPQPCYFIIGENAELEINNHVGISSTGIVCWNKICIGSNVKIGGGVVIYDTDFHSLLSEERNSIPEVTSNIKTRPIVIQDNVFIGAHSIILKGVTIGMNSIIGAGSVVSKSIPPNEIWAGNPAVFIRSLDEDKR